jgi:transposase
MARYKYIDTNPRFLPVDLARQLIPGTLEHAVNHLLDGPIDLSAFDARCRNDEGGAPAYPPAMLLKVVLIAYARGVISSRGIERLCQEHVTFIVLSGDTAPHFTTIAEFVSTLGDDIARVFAAVIAICDAEGLIGREMFAIDGVKLPSNAAKRRSGMRADFDRQATKLEATVQQILARHRAASRCGCAAGRTHPRGEGPEAHRAVGAGRGPDSGVARAPSHGSPRAHGRSAPE